MASPWVWVGGPLPENWDEMAQTLLTLSVQFDHKARVELKSDGLGQRSNLQSYMDEFQGGCSSPSFVGIKVLIFIQGLCLPEDRR